MRLSVIVPVYNVEAYLEECVESLLAQTVKELEIILVDDGSKDRSGEIADRYARAYPGKVYSLHTENGGQGRARNLALPMARGEYVGFVDSDDYVAPDMYEKLLRRAEETGADVVICDFLERFADGREQVLPAALQGHPLSSAGSSCNKIFRRSVIGELRFPEGLWYEDFFFSAVMLIRSHRTETVAEPLYVYRRGQPSTMHNENAEKNLDILEIMDRLERELDSLDRHGDYEFFLINHVLLDTINRLACQQGPNRREVIGKIRRYVREKLPHLFKCESYRRETRNRRIVMYLNYHGLEDLGQALLRLKRSTKK